MPIRTHVAQTLATTLFAFSGLTLAGDAPPVFRWLSPVDGLWGSDGVWDEAGIPGRGAFEGADVILDAPGSAFTVSLASAIFEAPFAVGHVTLGGQARLSAPLFAQPNSVLRSVSMMGENRFDISHAITVSEHLTINADSSVRMLRYTLDVGGDITNDGVMEFTRGIMRASSVLNRGRIESIDYSLFDFTELVVSGTLVNEGVIFAATPRFAIEGDIIHRGIVEVPAAGTLTLTGNQTFDPGAQLLGNGQLRFFGSPGQTRIVSGAVEFAGVMQFENAGSWTFEGPTTTGSITSSGLIESMTFADTFRSTGDVTLAAQAITFSGEARFGSRASFTGATLELTGPFAFEGDLSLNGVSAHFQTGLEAGGNISITASSDLTFGPGAAVSAPNGDITWSRPNGDINVSLSAGDEIIVGARRLNGTLSARRIRLGSGTTALNTDPTVTEDVLIAGTALSIGAVGEIAQRTIHGDLTSTFALSQGWDFDIAGSGGRGVAESDTLTITGDATIYGILRVGAIGEPSDLRAGDEFTLFAAESLDATFRFVSLPDLEEGLSFDLIVDPTQIRLVVVPAPAAAFLLALCGLSGVPGRRRSTLAES